MPFTFLDPGTLVDRELTLIVPEARWIDEILKSSSHPITAPRRAADASLTRRRFSTSSPMPPVGTSPPTRAQAAPGVSLLDRLAEPVSDPPICIAGGIGLRIGTNPEIELYSGNFGYHVFPARAAVITRSAPAGCCFRWRIATG